MGMTFRLENVYITNLVKCGLNNSDGKYKGIVDYDPNCVANCYQHFLSKEIEILKPSVVFAMGSAVHSWLISLLGESISIQQLPHPAGRRRGFRDEHYKVLYYWLVLARLHHAGIIGGRALTNRCS
jgi:uracil-DNA glycosylase